MKLNRYQVLDSYILNNYTYSELLKLKKDLKLQMKELKIDIILLNNVICNLTLSKNWGKFIEITPYLIDLNTENTIEDCDLFSFKIELNELETIINNKYDDLFNANLDYSNLINKIKNISNNWEVY